MGNKKSTTNKLDKNLVQQYHELTKLSEDEIQEWYQEFYKECPDGKLTWRKFRRIFVRYFRRRYADCFCNAIFKLYDEDGNGYISFAEFLIALSPASQLNFKDHLGLLFDVYDESQNKRLDMKELTKMIEVMFDLVDPIEPVNRAAIEDIADEIMSELKRETGLEEFDKNRFVDRCSKHPEIQELLAPNMKHEKSGSNSTDTSKKTQTSDTSNVLTQKESSQSSSNGQSRTVMYAANRWKKMTVLTPQIPPKKSQVHPHPE